MICPFCQRQITIIGSELYCDQPDHEFWKSSNSGNFWFILHKPTDLFIDEHKLTTNKSGEDFMSFENLLPEEGSIILHKFLKIKAFI